MKNIHLKTVLLAILALLVFSCNNKNKNKQEAKAEPYQLQQTIYYGGDIITMESDQPQYAEAVVQREGKIVFVGDKKEALNQFKGKAKEVDLQGKTLLPGFVDGHGHLYLTGLYYWTANLLPAPDGTCKNVDDIIAQLNAWKETDDGKLFIKKYGLIMGFGYDDSQLEEKNHPTAADLDKVSTEIPVVITHQSGHMGVVNHVGLEKFNITKSTPDPAGGHIRKDKKGNPVGLLEETAFQTKLVTIFSNIDDEANGKIIAIGQNNYIKNGYTTAQEGGGNSAFDKQMEKAAEKGILKIDLVNYTTPYMGGMPALESSPYHTKNKSYKNHYRVGGMKLVLDGSPQGKTAWLSHPYHVPPPGESKDYKGYPSLKKEDVEKYVRMAFKNQWQLLAHTNGDAALDEYLETVGNVMDDLAYNDHRTTIIHGQVIRKDQIQTISDLGMYASEYAVHTFYWGDWHLKSVLGSPRAEYISPCRDLIDAGINITSHSDCPVIPPNSMRIIDATVNRTTRSGLVLGPNQRITPYEGLLTQTRWAAKQYFEEDTKGTLTEGKLADFVILDKNPLKVDSKEIHNIQVMETIKEGETVYKK